MIGRIFFRSYLLKLLLLMLTSLWGCLRASQTIDNNEIFTQSKVRPIDVDATVAERVGQEALEKMGYEEIIRLADKAGLSNTSRTIEFNWQPMDR